METPSTITCIGEILWDALPSGLFLGGAPLNVCLNLHELGVPVIMVSRVGEDRLGREAVERIERAGLATASIQTDREHETGFVKVRLDSDGNPQYEIVQPAAWDFIDIGTPGLQKQLSASWAVVYGTLAHRMNPELKALGDLNCVKVLDMNLRAPHYEKHNVLTLIEKSDILKMNDEELRLLQQWDSLKKDAEHSCRQLSDRYQCSTVCVTMGGKGSALLHQGKWYRHGGFPVKVVDAVGAGDAFLAAMLYGLKTGRPDDELLPIANAAGAYVASRSGANPGYSVEGLQRIVQGGSVLSEQ